MERHTWSKVFTRRHGMHAHRFLPNSLGTSAWFSTLICLLVTRNRSYLLPVCQCQSHWMSSWGCTSQLVELTGSPANSLRYISKLCS